MNEAEEKLMPQYGENQPITDGNYDQSLAVKCVNGTFVGQKKENVISYKGIPFVGQQPVALTIVDYMQENHLSRAEMAKALEVSPQYLSRILSGTENFSIKSVAKNEATLGVSCLEPVYA